MIQAATNSSWGGRLLVEAAKDGDPAAIALLIAHAYPHVRRFANTLCSTPQDAEDAAQEAVLILARKVGTLRASTALASWMFQIVRHECLRRARFFASRRELLVDEDQWSAVAGVAAGDVEADALRALDADQLAAAISALPRTQRQILIMRDVQGLPDRAVADALGLSRAAVKSALHRARAAVRAYLTT